MSEGYLGVVPSLTEGARRRAVTAFAILWKAGRSAHKTAVAVTPSAPSGKARKIVRRTVRALVAMASATRKNQR